MRNLTVHIINFTLVNHIFYFKNLSSLKEDVHKKINYLLKDADVERIFIHPFSYIIFLYGKQVRIFNLLIDPYQPINLFIVIDLVLR